MPRKNRRLKSHFFRHLPSELVTDILARLPIRTTVICKCVCRSGRDLLLTRGFADFHLSKSVPVLVIGNGICFGRRQNYLKIYEFDDSLGLENHDLHYKPLTKINYKELTGSSNCTLQGSANGLVLLHRRVSRECDALYVCNPVTREYIKILYDRLIRTGARFTYGFGVSRMIGQHKVVRILQNDSMSICLVYTLGTAIWRSIALPAPFHNNDDDSIGVCLNGNLHWLVHFLNASLCILCFDLETETFSTFSLPSPLRISEEKQVVLGLVVLGDCLCVSDNISVDEEVIIWLMKEYGDDKSWAKEFVIENRHEEYDLFECSDVNPIKVFKDGDILMAMGNTYMIEYSSKYKFIIHCEVFEEEDDDDDITDNEMKGMLHTSSFFPLSSFVNERVSRC